MKTIRCILAACAMASIVLLAACQRHHDEDLSQFGQPSLRLVGHWADAVGDNLFYGPIDGISHKGNFFMVEPDGRTAKHQYQVVNDDPSSQTVQVNLLFAGGDSRTETDVIAADGAKLTVGTLINDHYISETLGRVDNATAAPKSYYMAGVSAEPTPLSPPPAAARAFTRAPNTAAALASAVSHQRAVNRVAAYLIWLYATALVILLLVPMMYLSDLGWPAVLIHWAVAIVGMLACLFLLHAPISAGIFGIAVGMAMLMRAVFPRSSFS